MPAVRPRHSGWCRRFLTLWRGAQLVAAVPLLRQGAFLRRICLRLGLAEAQERAGAAYYPKWLVSVPFTPVAGTRLLAIDAPARAAALAALLDLARHGSLSSLHVLFAPPAQISALQDQGLLMRNNLQFHWHNRGYANFEAFLLALTQPKRKNIRAERRKVHEAGVHVDRRVGTAIDADDWRFFVRCYDNTYLQRGGMPYLNLAFFRQIRSTCPNS